MVTRSMVEADPILAVDGHVHSTWSDGADGPTTNLAAAVAAGLQGVVMVDHVRASTTWLPSMVREVDGLRAGAAIDVRIGVEVKVLDVRGALDLPDRLDGVEVILVADHRFPGPSGPVDPADMARWLRAGAVRPRQVVEELVGALAASLGHGSIPMVLAHPFSLLPKLGLAGSDLPDEAVRRLAARCRETGTAVEVNEKWRCPDARMLGVFRAEGVRIVAGSDAHRAGDVGRWVAVRSVLEAPGSTEAPETSDGRGSASAARSVMTPGPLSVPGGST
jgi:putative hydrolase